MWMICRFGGSYIPPEAGLVGRLKGRKPQKEIPKIFKEETQ